MKQTKIIAAFLILTGLYSCDPDVTFNEPQPTGTKNIQKFPNRLNGQYLSVQDSSMLIITEKLIQRIYDYDYVFHPNQLDSTIKIVGDTVTDLETNEKYEVKPAGDSLLTHVHRIDTLFQMNYDNVVRKLKGYYFLNTRYNKDSWVVDKIKLSKGQLSISRISNKLDIDNLKEITESSADTVPPYKFSATKKQFRKFVKNDGFRDSEIFVKQK